MMNNISWEAAISNRRSVRSYEMHDVEEKTLSGLRNFASEMRVPFDHDVEVRFFKAMPDRRLYNNLKVTPRDGVAFIADTDNISISKAGFAGEMIILYATVLGLATCWFGHYSPAELEHIMPHLGEHASQPLPKWGYGNGTVPGRRAICISPLGYRRDEGIRLMDRMQVSFMSYKRKPLGSLLEGGISEDRISPEIRYALDLARKAPSAANSQHWRFMVSDDCKTVSIAKPVGYKHIKWEHPDVDIGICACHFWLGLLTKGIGCRVSLSEEHGRAMWRFKIV